MSQPNPMVSVLEAAAILRIPPGRLYGWVREGRVLHVTCHGEPVIPRYELERLAHRYANTRKPKPNLQFRLPLDS